MRALLRALSRVAELVAHYEVVEGRKENYVNGGAGSVEFWIYVEGADFVDGPLLESEENHWIYEPQDFGSDQDLIDAFVDDLVRVASKGDDVARSTPIP